MAIWLGVPSSVASFPDNELACNAVNIMAIRDMLCNDKQIRYPKSMPRRALFSFCVKNHSTK